MRLTGLIRTLDDPRVEALLDAPPGLTLELAPAEAGDGPTVAATVGVAVGPAQEMAYGHLVMSAVVLVAVDLDSGAVFTGTMAPTDSLPALQMRPPRPPRLPDAAPGRELPTLAEMAVADLVGVLGLRRCGSRLAVFAWLDDLVSPVVHVTLPDTGAPPLPPVEGAAGFELVVQNGQEAPPAHMIPLAPGQGIVALVAMDGETRSVTAAGWTDLPAGPLAIDPGAYLRGLAPSVWPTRFALFEAPDRVTLVMPG